MYFEGKRIWKWLSGIAFIISAIVLGLGLDKMLSYDKGEYHNAYVGGDAYNYIINGNYATGFFVLATIFAMMAIGFLALYYLSMIVDGQETLFTTSREIKGSVHKIEEKTQATFDPAITK